MISGKRISVGTNNPSMVFAYCSSVFIYSCPTTSPVKLRMLYSSGIGSLVNAIKDRLGSDPIVKRIELSDPKEINEEFIRVQLGYEKMGDDKVITTFARPKGPTRKK
jgi:twinfilin